MGDDTLKRSFRRVTAAVLERPVLAAFTLGFVISGLTFLPFVIMDRGMFFYYGDFNVQQIPFYQLVHRAIRSGDVRWNWFTDLGANFVGSYSFYNLFSPFFWLTLPFPNWMVPYFMAPLLVLKTSCAAATGCLFIRRFVKDPRFAVIGGLLYAYSGFTTYNIFFNHFHEVIVFFPLLFWALERLVVDGKRGPFAWMVAVNAIVNYWFFIGTVVFTILYFLVRTLSNGWKMNLRIFFTIALEAVLGVLISAFALIPSVLAILGNPRTTSGNLLSGWDFWLYGHEQRLPAIVQSIFFPPDIPSRPNFFPDHGAKWASLSAWLPMIGPAFVISYLSSAKGWLKNMLWISLVIALVPGLNSLFILFNHSYYARWFYMPILLMSLASALALERYLERPYSCDLKKGMYAVSVVVLAVTAVIGFTPRQTEEGNWLTGLCKYQDRFWLYVSVTVLGLIGGWLLVRKFVGKPRYFRIFVGIMGLVCVLYSVMMLALGRGHSDSRNFIREFAMDGADALDLPSEDGRFDRSDIYDNMDNLGMYWRLPNIQAFHSIVPVSLMEFYPSVGVKRDVSSKPQPELYELRSLLSVRWLFVDRDEPQEFQPSVKYFSYFGAQLGFNIYENENYLPMGIGYDRYMTMDDFEAVVASDRARMLHRAVVLEDQDIPKLMNVIDPLPVESLADTSEEHFLEDVQNRRENSAVYFARDNSGFTSRTDLDSEQVVFYSVPYDAGWSATVNGVETRVLKVNNGFCGVPVPSGPCEIRFEYRTPGLKEGILFTVAGLLLFFGYRLLWGRLKPLVLVKSWSRHGEWKVDGSYLPYGFLNAYEVPPEETGENLAAGKDLPDGDPPPEEPPEV